MRDLRPSAAHRWLKCTASPADIEVSGGEEDESSPYAAEGTLAHILFAQMLGNSEERELAIGDPRPVDGHDLVVTTEMWTHVAHAVAYVESFSSGIVFSEIGVCFETTIRGDQRDVDVSIPGTADVLLVTHAEPHTLHVMDFKYGQGVKVEAEDNPQMLLYALGALQTMAPVVEDVLNVELHVLQPRLDNYSTQYYRTADVGEWRVNVLEPAIKEAMGLGERPPTYYPSEDTCRWCPMAPCAASMQYIADQFEDISMDAVETIKLAQLATFLDRSKHYEQVIHAARDRAKRVMLAGGEVLRWKLVEGRSNRQWTDEDEVEAIVADLHHDMTHAPSKLFSPAAMEKELGRDEFRERLLPDLITKPPGAPTLAPADDPRPAWTPADAFQQENDDE